LASFDLEVINVNDVPTITGTPATVISEDNGYLFTPTGADVDTVDTLEYSITNQPSWANFDTTTGQLSGTPTNSDVGITSDILVSVTDNIIASPISLASFDIRVNARPIITGEPDTRIAEDSTYTFTPVGADVDANTTLTYSITNKPSWATFSATTGELTGTPGNSHVGTTNNIVISVSDNYIATDLDSFNLEVTNTNDAPVILTSLVVQNSGFESGTISGNGGAYEYVTTNGSEIRDNWTFSASTTGVGLTAVASSPWVNSIPEGSNAAFIQRNGELSQELNFLTAGDYLISYKIMGRTNYSVQRLVVKIDDETLTTLSGYSNSEWEEYTTTYTCTEPGVHTLKFQGQGSGDYATSIDDISVMKSGGEITEGIAISIAENIIEAATVATVDVDGDTLTYSLTGGADQSKFTIDSASGVLSFVSAANYEVPTDFDLDHEYIVEVTVTDNGVGSLTDTKTIAVTVTDVNEAPSITGTPAKTIDEDSEYSFTPTGADVDENTILTYSITNKPSWANFDTTTGKLHGTPENTHVGTTNNIVISVSDNYIATDLDSFNLEVINTNDAPRITGVATGAFTLESMGTLVAWYDGNDPHGTGSVSTGDIIETWVDKSDNNISVTQSDLSKRPIVVAEGNIHSVQFDGNDMLGVDNAIMEEAFSEMTIISVVKSTTSGYKNIMGRNYTVWEYQWHGSSKINMYIDSNEQDGDSDTYPFDGQARIGIFRYHDANNALDQWIDGTSKTTSNYNRSIPISTNDFHIGARAGTGEFFNGEILELIIYSKYLTDENREKVEDYLAKKWGLTGTDLSPELGEIPVVQDSGSYEDATENRAYSFILEASDVDSNDTLTYSITGTPSWADFDTATGALTGTPTNADVGTSSAIVITVTDSANATDVLAAFNITVGNVNDAPVIAGTPNTGVDEDAAYSFIPTVTDIDSGDTKTFSIANKPSWADFDAATGALTGTPTNADVGTNTAIVITVTDSANTTDDLAAFNIRVTNINDAPVADDQSNELDKNTELAIYLHASDVDEGELAYVVVTQPANGELSGVVPYLTYTPNSGYVGSDLFTFKASDGSVDSNIATINFMVNDVNNAPEAIDDEYSVNSFERVSLDVMLNDSDPEYDELELVSAQASTGEVVIAGGMLMFTPEQGISGVISITYNIKDTANNFASAIATVTIESEQEPVITVPADLCGEFTVNATGLYTRIDLGEASAVDRSGNDIPVLLLDDVTLYPPGISEAYWQATDVDGNTVVEKQLVCVNPLVSIESDQQVPEGASVEVTIFLNGEAPVYPVVIPYDVVGHEDDHTLTSGEVMIESGTEVSLLFDIVNDELVEDDEVVELILSNTLNLGTKSSHSFTITQDNIAPEITLDVIQQQENRVTVSQVDGDVAIRSKVYDANQQDRLTYQWQVSDDNVINLSEDERRFSFNPAGVPVGSYQISLTVNDDAIPQGVDIEVVYINIVSELSLLTDEDSDGDGIPDNVEGYQDSDGDGIPDYQDTITQCNVLPETGSVSDGYLIEGQSGACLRLGALTIEAQAGGAQMTDKGAMIADPDAIIVGGIFDYVSYGLPSVGTSVSIVLPQQRPIPADAVYRKYRESTGWDFFVEDVNNSLWSTQGEPGHCPPPNDSAWTLGLTEGHWCVQQVIEDGGVNDDDLTVNGTVVDPGGVAVMMSANNFPVAVDDYVDSYFDRDVSIDVLSNDTDEDNDTLVITSASSNVGEVTIIDGMLWYVPKINYGGSVTINYGVSDSNGGSDLGVVYINMLLNQAPVVNGESSQLDQGQSISINLLDNDSDLENDTLTLVTVDNDEVSFTENGMATFTPSEDFFGSVTINYTVQDSAGNRTTGIWSINVIEVFIIETKTSGGALYWLISLLMLSLSIRFLMQSRYIAKGQK